MDLEVTLAVIPQEVYEFGIVTRFVGLEIVKALG